MKGVTELQWVIILVLIVALVAFIIILAFTTDFTKKIVNLINNFSLKDFLDMWQKGAKG